jgi:cell wall-associated NlpC family hydrolase
MPARVDAQESKRLVMNASAERLRDSVVSFAKRQLGKRYQLGGSTPTQGFDCSGLVKYVMSAFKLELPRTAMDQAKEGTAVKKDTSRLLPGDLLTFGRTKMSPVSHVGIYVGDGRYIHASSVAGRVIESPIDRAPAPLVRVWSGARRMLVERKRRAPATTAAPTTALPTAGPTSPKGGAS